LGPREALASGSGRSPVKELDAGGSTCTPTSSSRRVRALPTPVVVERQTGDDDREASNEGTVLVNSRLTRYHAEIARKSTGVTGYPQTRYGRGRSGSLTRNTMTAVTARLSSSWITNPTALRIC